MTTGSEQTRGGDSVDGPADEEPTVSTSGKGEPNKEAGSEVAESDDVGDEYVETEDDAKVSPASTTTADGNPEPEAEITPQSESLRQQQYVVGVGGAVLAGLALAISSVQHFPSLPNVVPILAGLVGGGLVYWIVQRSLFPTEAELAAE